MRFFRKNNTDYEIIAKSKYFDKKWYLENNNDVATAKIDPVQHYLHYGWKEHRNPSPNFDAAEYLNTNQDVKDAFINPLVHYLKYGIKENRVCCGVLTKATENKYLFEIKNVISKMQRTAQKIVLISHELSTTGAPYALLKAANILKDNGCDVLVLSPKAGPLKKCCKNKKIPCLVIPHLFDLNISFFKSAFQNVDFVICNTILLTSLAAKLQNILPTLLYVHEAGESGKTNQIHSDKIINTLKNINQIACVSPFAKSFYEPYSKDIQIIRNSVAPNSISTKNKHKNLRFAYAGAVTSINKNTPLLVECFKKLYKEHQDIELHIIGQDDTDLAKQLKKQKIKNLVFHGIVTGKNKDKIFNQMDVFVIPSQRESCSLVALEGASHSKCIILTDNVGAKYMFKNRESALICKTDNKNSLYKSMKEVYENQKLREKISNNAYKAYLEYATESVTEKDLFAAMKVTTDKFHKKKKVNKLTIIVPVYNAAAKVNKCIQSIIKNTKLSDSVKLLIIDDCSPEPDVKKMLKQYEDTKFITIVKNKKNLGYTLNINKAIKLAKKSDVILLNSDTIVTKDWVTKIQNAAYMSPSVGTVTPVSNSAGAFSVPQSGTNIIPKHLNIEKMGKIVSDCGNGKFFDAPTGNGFCFFIKRRVFDEIGLFDEKNFPRGYGEENDFSMRVKQGGFLNIVTLDTYIFHHEHASFKESCHQLMTKSLGIINKMYPQYQKEIRVFGNNATFNCVKEQIAKKIEG